MNQSSSAFAPYLGGPGLQVTISPGTVLCSNVITKLPLTIISLAPNTTSFVYIQFLQIGDITLPFTPQANPAQVTPIIAVTTDTKKGPDGIPLALVVTAANSV